MNDRLLTRRWLEPGSYGGRWPERSARLLALFAESEDLDRGWSFSEYGCGPHAPFRAAAAGRPGLEVATYDMRAWAGDTRVVDLNQPDFAVERSDVAVLSGVCEYLHSIEATLAVLARHHGAFLLSYAALPLTARENDGRYLQQLRKRSVARGWRNHLVLPELVAALGRVGFVVNAASWRGQALLHVRGFSG